MFMTNIHCFSIHIQASFIAIYANLTVRTTFMLQLNCFESSGLQMISHGAGYALIRNLYTHIIWLFTLGERIDNRIYHKITFS